MKEISRVYRNDRNGKYGLCHIRDCPHIAGCRMRGCNRNRERKKTSPGRAQNAYACMCGGSSCNGDNEQLIQVYGSGDPTRMGAQVISGIGFLGAGTIITDRQSRIRGLTTAAGLWASACVGLAIGSGYYLGGILTCIFILIILQNL